MEDATTATPNHSLYICRSGPRERVLDSLPVELVHQDPPQSVQQAVAPVLVHRPRLGQVLGEVAQLVVLLKGLESS